MKDTTRILVSVPNWVGDVVMATAALRAIRRRFRQARIVHLMRAYVEDVLAGSGLADDVLYWPDPAGDEGSLALFRRMRKERFDLAILLTNSFRSALAARLAGIPRRVGYARDGRGWLLTDRLYPPRARRRYVPIPALDYYNALARHAGCENPGDCLSLATTPADEAEVDSRLGTRAPGRPLIVLNPGANYGSAKCWPAERYAAVADALTLRWGARVVASLGPKEKRIAELLSASAREPIEVFVDPPLGLGPLKALIRRCDLLITNDTGPRHFAAAFNVPVLTVFGSSDPAWTDTRFSKERIVMLDLECQPCMERICPLKHHDCMQQLSPEKVLAEVDELLGFQPPERQSDETSKRRSVEK